MRTIMVLNAKGGSGKSTIATNLASYYASLGKNVVLADFDQQESSLGWLRARPRGRPPIKGIAAYKEVFKPARDTDYIIMDAPASVHGNVLAQLVKKAETFIVPVLPSPIDMRAAVNFIAELKNTGPITRKEAKICLVANRARGNTNIFLMLDDFLKKVSGVPYVTALRENQNYIKAAMKGIGIFEFAPGATAIDREEWEPLIKWIESKSSH